MKRLKVLLFILGFCSIAAVAQPLVLDDRFTVDEDATITMRVQSNDKKPALCTGTLRSVIIEDVRYGTAFTNESDTHSIVYIPDPNYFGFDTLRYQLCDCDNPNSCASATVFITVNSVNDKPEAYIDTPELVEDSFVIVDVQANDYDLDLDNTGFETRVITNAQFGTVKVLDMDSVEYTPLPNYHGTDTVLYELCDLGVLPQLCDTNQIVFTIHNINDKPEANPDTASTPEDVMITIPVTKNDFDADPKDFFVIEVGDGAQNGIAAISTSGNTLVDYVPNPNFFGIDSFDYVISDPEGATDTSMVYVTVTPVSDAPVAVDDIKEVEKNQTSVIDILANDYDLDNDPLTVTFIKGADNGTYQFVNGVLEYTPNPNFEGNDRLTYVICDTTTPVALCDTADVLLTITNVDDAPIANNDFATLEEDRSIVVDVMNNDEEKDGDDVVLSIITDPENGTARIENGEVVYEPNANFNGSDSLVYTLCDENTALRKCDTAVVYFTVTPVGDAPIAEDDEGSVDENETGVFDVLENDTDPDGDSMFIEIIGGPNNGVATINEDGEIEYTPNEDFRGADTIVYRVCDTTGLCDTAQLVIFVGELADVEVPNNFTPNGDGNNDDLIIKNIEFYPNNTFTAFNRWGDVIYTKKGYSNDDPWDGKARNARGGGNGNPLPDGVYYFLLEIENEETIADYIFIKR